MAYLLDTAQEHLPGLADAMRFYSLYRDGDAYYMTSYVSHDEGVTPKERHNVSPETADILMDTYLLQVWREAWDGTLDKSPIHVDLAEPQGVTA